MYRPSGHAMRFPADVAGYDYTRRMARSELACRPVAIRHSRFATLSGNSRSDRTAHAGAAEAAITVRVLRQILLVIILGEIERRRLAGFRGGRSHPFGFEP